MHILKKKIHALQHTRSRCATSTDLTHVKPQMSKAGFETRKTSRWGFLLLVYNNHQNQSKSP